MDAGRGPGRFSLLGSRLPRAFELQVFAVAPGCRHPYDEADWRDAIVVVERGEIELECLGGSRGRFESGDVLWLAGLPIRALDNRGHEPAVLVAVSRRGKSRPGRRSRGRAPPP